MMMMGSFGSSGNGGGGGSSSSSSNLSPLAPPFTVDRSLPKPLVDLTEPPLNWLNTQSLTFDSMPSSNAAGYGFSFNSPSTQLPSPPKNTTNPITSSDEATFMTSLLGNVNPDAMATIEAKPYYPSYVSPPATYSDYMTQTLSGLWDISRGWEHDKKAELGESFCSKEMNMADLPVYKDYAGKGAHSSKGVNTCEEKSRSIDMLSHEKYLAYAEREMIDYKSFLEQNPEFMPLEYPRKSVLGSTSAFPETCSLAPSPEQVRSRNQQMPYGASYDKGAKHNGISPNDVTPVMKSSTGHFFRSPPVGFSSSAPNTSSSNNVEFGSGTDNIAGNNNFLNMKDFHPLQSSEGKVHFDSSHISFHREGENHRFLEEKKEKPLGNASVIKDSFRAKSGLKVPHSSPGGFNLTLDNNEAINYFEDSSESLDHYNPAVDSPCWKGAPGSHYSPSGNSEAVAPQLIRKIDACNSSNPIEPLVLPINTNSAVKFSSQKQNESLYQDYRYLENCSAPFPKRPSATNLLFREHVSDDDVKAGSYHMKPSCTHGVQFSDDIDRPRKEHSVTNKSVEFNFKPFHSMQQSLEEGKLTFGKVCASGTSVTDVGMNIGDALEGCSSHVPFHATEHVLSSPYAVEASPAKLTKLHEQELVPKMCVQTLINTMRNLSELLLFHCSNETSELKKQDIEALKNVVHNLDKCTSKNLRPVAPSQESVFPPKTYQFLRDLPKLHETVAASRPQVTKVAALNQPDHQNVQAERKHYTMSGKEDETCLDFASIRSDADRVKEDNMTQAIKKVLSDNFFEEEETQPQVLLYKNLWLEAEAALCSIKYKDRFNRMKIEMERCKSLKAKDLSENTTEQKKRSCSTFSPDLLAAELKGDSTRDISVPEFPIKSSSSHPDDVMARFHILKRQMADENCTSPTDVEKLSSSIFFPDLIKVDTVASEAKDDQTPDMSTWGSLVSSSSSHADDVEASVMSRLHILKNRIDNSSCVNVEGEQPPQVVDLGFIGERKHWPTVRDTEEDGILDVNVEPVFQYNSANDPEDKLTVEEFHLHVKDDPVIESHRMNRLGNQLPASCYDSSSSDWEHVSKEELPGQNC